MPSCFASPASGSLSVRKGSPKLCPLFAQIASITMPYKNKVPRPWVVFVTPDDISQDSKKAVALVQSVIAGGVSLVQIRDQKASPSDIQDLVKSLLANGIPAGKLTVNGISPADGMTIDQGLGVHIKERDIGKYLPEAKIVTPADNVIGCAVHSASSAKQALSILQPSYFQIGTMYATRSHPGKIPEGPGLVREIRDAVGNAPILIGIGGVDEGNLHNVFENGGDGIAVISLLAAAEDPFATSASLVSTCKQAYKPERA